MKFFTQEMCDKSIVNMTGLTSLLDVFGAMPGLEF